MHLGLGLLGVVEQAAVCTVLSTSRGASRDAHVTYPTLHIFHEEVKVSRPYVERLSIVCNEYKVRIFYIILLSVQTAVTQTKH